MLTKLERSNPERADELRKRAGWAFANAVGNRRADLALGISPRRIRQLKQGDSTSFLSRLVTAIASLPMIGASPYPLAEVTLCLCEESLIDMDEHQLIARFWELVEREAVAEGIENKHSAMLAHSGDLASFANALRDENTIGIELEAVTRKLIARKINPWARGYAS